MLHFIDANERIKIVKTERCLLVRHNRLDIGLKNANQPSEYSSADP